MGSIKTCVLQVGTLYGVKRDCLMRSGTLYGVNRDLSDASSYII
jgi:hypothetical protein